MAYVDLTTEQQTQLDDWLTVVRPMMGEQGRLHNHLRVAKDAHTSHISAILAELAGPDEIPNATGLTGATAITKDELTAILVDANAVLATYDTDAKRQLAGKFAGAGNMLG